MTIAERLVEAAIRGGIGSPAAERLTEIVEKAQSAAGAAAVIESGISGVDFSEFWDLSEALARAWLVA